MMLNPWIVGLECVQQGWQAQSAMAFRLMRLFGGGVPDQATSSLLIQDTVAVETKAEEEAPAAIADEQDAPAAIADKQEAPAAIVDARPLKAPRVLRVSKRASRVKPPSVSKRAAAASQSRASKAVRRSARKSR
jgi:hypothetical protein